MLKHRLIPIMFLAAAAILSLASVSGGYALEFGSNWTAEYYDNPDLDGDPIATRSGINGVNFNFGEDKPIDDDDIDNNEFSIRFTSTQTFNPGVYEFVLASDDGARVFIDGELVLDKFSKRPLTTDRFTRTMTAGSHSLKVEYFDNEGNASIQFQWFLGTAGTPGAGTPSVIGTSVVVATAGPPTPIPPTPLPAIPQGSLSATVIRAQVLLVRDAPYLGANAVGRIRRGQTYQVVGRDDRALWFLLQLSDRQAWAWHYYLFINGNEFSAPVVSSFITVGNPAAYTGVVAQTQSVLKLRAEPNADSEQIGRVGWGDVVPILARSRTGYWQVIYKGTTGWVASGFLKIIEGDIETIVYVD